MKERLTSVLPSLTAKYVAVFVLLVAVPSIGISIYLLDSSYNDNKRALIAVQQERADALAGKVEDSLTATVDHLRSVHVDGLSLQDTDAVLRGINDVEPYGAAFYIDSNGNVWGGAGLGGFPDMREPFAIAKKKRRYLSEVGSDQRLIVLATENAGPGAVGTWLFAADKIQELVAGTRLGRAGYAYVVTGKGGLIAYPNRKLRNQFERGLRKTLDLPQVRAANASAEGKGTATGRNIQGTRVLSTWSKVRPVGWKVFVEQPESAAFAPLRGKIWKTALLISGFVAAAVALSILLARRFVRPIRRMRVAAARIGAGAYDERIELKPRRRVAVRSTEAPPTDRFSGSKHAAQAKSVVVEQPLAERSRQDDLGALADDLNRMAASLQQSTAQLEQKVEERTRELQVALEQLAEKTRELELASAHKSEFLANMSHELRTPLNAIIGFTQVLQQKLFGDVNEKQEEYLEDVNSSADHLLALINDILDLSKVEAGQVELEVERFSLRDALERGMVMIRERATKNGVALQLELDPQVDLVEGDERRIRQVVFNLLSNAVKFTSKGGHVDVSATRQDGEVMVAVADTGPGIAPEDQDRIFEEFQQAKSDGNGERPEGTGLGLALSKSLVELHGGRIWVESKPGQGSTFTFTIPVGSAS